MNNEPAFPITDSHQHEYMGMTLRDYFAGKALIGLLNISPEIARANKVKRISKEDMAKNAFIYADAMLEARKQ